MSVPLSVLTNELGQVMIISLDWGDIKGTKCAVMKPSSDGVEVFVNMKSCGKVPRDSIISLMQAREVHLGSIKNSKLYSECEVKIKWLME